MSTCREILLIRCILRGMLEEVKVSDYDRVDQYICGWEVRAWAVKVSGQTKYYIGYKSPHWSGDYWCRPIEDMAETLWTCKHTFPANLLDTPKGRYRYGFNGV